VETAKAAKQVMEITVAAGAALLVALMVAELRAAPSAAALAEPMAAVAWVVEARVERWAALKAEALSAEAMETVVAKGGRVTGT